MSNTAKEYVDSWDQFTSGHFHRPLPARSVYEAFYGDVESVFISEDRGEWWLKSPRIPGQTRFSTLTEAKKAGDEIVEAAYASQSKAILDDAKLDPTRWRFDDAYGVQFESIDDDKIVIVGVSPTQWELWNDGDDEPVGVFSTAREAADAREAVPAPGM